MYDATGRVVPPAASCWPRSPAAPTPSPTLVWADADFLLAHDVAYWAGPRSLPLWLPPEGTGMVARDVEPTYAAGLSTRPLADTARDTLAWLAAPAGPHRAPASPAEEEQELLAAYTD